MAGHNDLCHIGTCSEFAERLAIVNADGREVKRQVCWLHGSAISLLRTIPSDDNIWFGARVIGKRGRKPQALRDLRSVKEAF